MSETSPSVITYEALAEGGLVRLPEGVELPVGTRCYVVVPTAEPTVPQVGGPHLADEGLQGDFTLEVIDLAGKERH